MKSSDEALRLCDGEKSLLASVIVAGLRSNEERRESTIQEEAENYVGRLYRKVEYLSFIGGTVPMLGLLGTVTGMMASFNVIAQMGLQLVYVPLQEGVMLFVYATPCGQDVL